MILVTHAVVGATVASFVPAHPVEGFVLGFLSHFILDSIPHWDYNIKSGFIDPDRNSRFSFSKDIIVDAMKIIADILAGFVLAYILFHNQFSGVAVYAGVMGALMPDILQFVQAKIPWKPLVQLRRFHAWIQSDKRFKYRPLVGAGMQVVLIIVVSATILLLR
ncbi:MAG: hypothetical protein WC757_00870 [Candidatus Paceibacterota bacterium]|jgi:hypothetical protein